jgi:ATP-dependent DNA ligase
MKADFPKLDTNIHHAPIPCQVQPKYDGELVVWSNGRLSNRYGRERILPFCTELPTVDLIGELYWGDGKRNFYEALSHLKNDDALLKFAVFGIFHANMEYSEQLKLLGKILPNSERVKVIYGQPAHSHLEIEQLCELNLSNGYEGSVIKGLASKDPSTWIKNKPDETMDLIILGVSKAKSAIAVGTPDGKIIGHCSLLGHPEIVALIRKENIIGETREDYLIPASYIVEVKHLGVIEPSGHLRSPRIARLREDLSKEDL